MNPIRHIRRLAAILAGLTATLLAWTVGTSTAFAMTDPPPGEPPGTGTGGGSGSPVLVRVHTIVAGGMPGWQITLIAVGAALVAAVLAVLLDRARAARRTHATTA